MRLDALWQLFLVRVRVYVREPAAVFWTFGFPLLAALALGIAFRARKPERIPVAVERDAALAAKLGADAGLAVTAMEPPEAARALRAGRVALVVVPGDPLAFRYDPTRPDGRLARLAVAAALAPPALRAADEPVSEPGARYIDFLVPGLIGMSIMSAGLLGIGFSVVDARARKQLKRLAATPMPRSHYLLAFFIGHLVLVTGLLAAILVFGRVIFDVAVIGSPALLALVAAAGAFSFAGLGVLVCSRTDNPEVLSGMNNAIMMPMLVTSGVFFSSSVYPDALQPLIRILPLTALNDALRAVMNEGAPLLALRTDLIVLAVWGAAGFLLGLRMFRWT